MSDYHSNPELFLDGINAHHRNIQRLTPNAVLAERTDSEKVTPKTVWRAHLYVYADEYEFSPQRRPTGKKVWCLAGYVSKTTTWRGPGYKFMFNRFGDSSIQFSRYVDGFAPTEEEAVALLTSLAKGMWP